MKRAKNRCERLSGPIPPQTQLAHFLGRHMEASGIVCFGESASSAARQRAHFMLVKDSFAAETALQLMMSHLKPPGVLLSVVGSARNFNVPVDQLSGIGKGLVKAASLADAWILTGGLDSGIMRWLGETLALQRHRCASPLIGVASWANVHGRDQLLKPGRGLKRAYHLDRPPSETDAPLEPNHTHFVFVESPPTADAQSDDVWTSHYEYYEQLKICAESRFGCPRVMLVLRGGPLSMRHVRSSLAAGAVLVIAAFSGGLASAIYEYVQTGETPAGWGAQAADFEYLRSVNAQEAAQRVEQEQQDGVEADAGRAVTQTRAQTRDHGCTSPPLLDSAHVCTLCPAPCAFYPVRVLLSSTRAFSPLAHSSFARAPRS